ncbi:MAG TPA: formate dehydrogenase subunit alpha [Chloroflexota bacterium]
MAITVIVDGKAVTVPDGSSVLDAVNQAGIPLPQLCKDPDRPPLGACRTCLVQIEGVRGYPASCSTPAQDGMVVSTTAPDVVRIRRGVLDLTLGMLPAARDRDGADGCGLGQLDAAAGQHGLTASRFAPLHQYPPDTSKTFFMFDRDHCILCGRCVAACQDVQHIGAIALIGKGHNTKVGTFGDLSMAESICTSCGQCVATCPTEALRPLRPARNVVRQVESTCPYCGVGCGVVLQVERLEDGGERLAVMADDVPSNLSSLGMHCVKGRFGTGYVHAPDRVTTPLVKRDGRWVEVSWDEALDYAATELAKRRGHFAALASAKGTNEDAYVIQKFARAVMGTNNVDHCTRLCHSPSVEAMLASVGSGATSNSYVDYEEAGCLMVVGSDTTSNHPVVAARLRKAVKRGARLVVVNPRRIDLCYYADLWLRQRPGTDVALFNGLAHIILKEGWWDREFVETRTEGFEAWRACVERYTPEEVSRITGVSVDDLYRAAEYFARPPYGGSCLIWGMGITQHINGTANAHAVINLALVTGQLGKPACGISPLRGQNNVQGCGDAGCIPTNLPGYQHLTGEHRAKFEQEWGVELPGERGLTVTEMMEAALKGDLKAMYIVGENPLLSEPDLHHAHDAIASLEFLVVQDLFINETAEYAHVFLPAAGAVEKEGTFTNSERRVQRVRKAIDPPGLARPDWEITCDLARRVAAKLGRPTTGFDYNGPAEIWAEHARLVPFLAGISYERLERGGIQWPCPTPDHPGTRYLYAESFPRGKGKFFAVEQGPEAAELPDASFPLILNTGRVLYHWHGGTITRRVDGLLALWPELQVAINPEDAAALGIRDGDEVRVTSRRGELTGVALVTSAQRKGEVFVPFVRIRDSAANFLTNSAYDPSSKMPEFKVCAVRVEKLPARVPAGASD